MFEIQSGPCADHPDDFLQPGEDPDWGASAAAERAKATCAGCPVLAACARAALTAGDTVDGEISAVAGGVIMAGIVCAGDMATRRHLRAILRPEPDDSVCASCNRSFGTVTRKARGLCSGCYTTSRRESVSVAARRGFDPPGTCVECDRPMVPWGRPQPTGHVRHNAHGRCNPCDMRARRRRLRAVA